MLNIRPLLLLPLALYSLSCAADDPSTTTTSTESTTTATTTTTSGTTTTSQTETATETAAVTETAAATETTSDVAPCTDQKIGTGVGLCGEDFTLLNSSKEAISLYDFAGDVILLDLSGFT